MKTIAIRFIQADPELDIDLAFAYFDISESEYLALTSSDEDRKGIYIEFSEQIQSTYSDEVSYQLKEDGLFLEFSEQVTQEIKVESPLFLKFDWDKVPINRPDSSENLCLKEKRKLLEDTLKAIFIS